MLTLSKRALLTLLLSAALLSACELQDVYLGNEPFDYVGAWSGTLQDSVGGEATVSLDVLTQYKDRDFYASGERLGGAWQATFPDGDNAGVMRGYALDQGFGVTLYSERSAACDYDIEGILQDGVIQGTYISSGCDTYVTGTFELRQQQD